MTTPLPGVPWTGGVDDRTAAIDANNFDATSMPAIEYVAIHGAKGDGSTDDTAAIQAAIDKAYSSGRRGTVELGPLTYVCNNLVLKRGVVLQGAGFATRLKAPANQASTGAVIRNSTTVDRQTNYNEFPVHAQVRGLMIDGNARAGAAGDGIRFASPDASGNFEPAHVTSPQWGTTDWSNMEDWNDSNVVIEDVLVADAGRHGIYAGTNARGIKIAKTYAYACRQVGFYVNASDYFLSMCDAGTCGDGFYLRSEDGRIVNCKSWYSRGAVDPGSAFWFTSSGASTDYSGLGYGFLIYSASGGGNAKSGVAMSSCVAQDNYGNGFVLYNTRGNILRACKSGGDVNSAVLLFAGGGGTCENNAVEVALVWGDRPAGAPAGSAAGTLVGITLDGANVQKNHITLHNDETNSQAAGFALLAESNSAKAYNNIVDGNAFEKWTTPTLGNSWVAADGAVYHAVAYRKVGGQVQLRGAINGGALQATAFTLPNWARPSKLAPITTTVYDASQAKFVAGMVLVDNSGTVKPYQKIDSEAWVAGSDVFYLDQVAIPI